MHGFCIYSTPMTMFEFCYISGISITQYFDDVKKGYIKKNCIIYERECSRFSFSNIIDLFQYKFQVNHTPEDWSEECKHEVSEACTIFVLDLIDLNRETNCTVNKNLLENYYQEGWITEILCMYNASGKLSEKTHFEIAVNIEVCWASCVRDFHELLRRGHEQIPMCGGEGTLLKSSY